MLRAVIIGNDSALTDPLEGLLKQIGHAAVTGSTEEYPLGGRLEEFLRDHAPNLVMLCLKQFGQAMECARQLDSAYPQLPVLALGREPAPDELLELMRTGVRELLTTPFQSASTAEALVRLRSAVEKSPPALFKETKSVFAFLPAQGGAGSSLVAANTAVALSRTGEWKTLLMDCDIINGLSRLLFRADPLYTLLDIAAQSHQLDSDIWRQMVARYQRLDLIASGRSDPSRHLEPSHMRHLLGYARRRYDVICMDVPNLTQVMIETLAAASKIFIVCTPETHSLFLAREKHRFLASHDLDSRVEFILNRLHRSARFATADCEQLLGQTIHTALPNDYQRVHRAIRDGAPVDEHSPLGKAFHGFATRLMAPERVHAPSGQSSRFLQHFCVTPRTRAS
ncbi:MAG: hypothetical protein IT160_02265 [Bryobacterales bacterium]|nr:hypothetical protein [Bryobacterales bacterium]